MGHPKKLRKKYHKPSHPWQKARIEEEIVLTREYGFKNKAEIWKASSLLSGFKRQAKRLAAIQSDQAKKESTQLFDRLKRLGLISENSFDAVLEISLRNVIDRRLQSIVLKKGLARSAKQARQFIVHNHIALGDKVIGSPSYLVRIEEEPIVQFIAKSALADEEHPERGVKEEIAELKAEIDAIKSKDTKDTEESPKEDKEETKEEVKEESKDSAKKKEGKDE